jgi:hypothetical protein
MKKNKTILTTTMVAGVLMSQGIVSNIQQEPSINTETLRYKVISVKRQGVNRDPNMPAVPDSLKWVVNTATLIYGKRDAVLIDCFLTVEQTRSLIDSIANTKRI